MEQVKHKRRDEIEAELEELKSRRCENCNSFDREEGKQPDGIGWETQECLYGVWVQPMEIDIKKISCDEWEKKPDNKDVPFMPAFEVEA